MPIYMDENTSLALKSLMRWCASHPMWLLGGGVALLQAYLALFVGYTHQSDWIYWRQMIGLGQFYWVVSVAGSLLVAVIFLDNWLKSMNSRLLEWSPWHVKANMAELPIGIKGYGWLYLALLWYCVPFFAWAEEALFRMPDANLFLAVLLGIIAFGAFHVLALTSVRMMVCAATVGGVLVAIYMRRQLLWQAVEVHATFNFLAILWVTYDMKLKKRVLKYFDPIAFRMEVRKEFPTLIVWWTEFKASLLR